MEICVPVMDNPDDDFLSRLEEDIMKILHQYGTGVGHKYYFSLSVHALVNLFKVDTAIFEMF